MFPPQSNTDKHTKGVWPSARVHSVLQDPGETATFKLSACRKCNHTFLLYCLPLHSLLVLSLCISGPKEIGVERCTHFFWYCKREMASFTGETTLCLQNTILRALTLKCLHDAASNRATHVIPTFLVAASSAIILPHT